MENLLKKGWEKSIFNHIEKGKPILGICLGMQLFFDWGEEDGGHKGLGLIKGQVKKMKTVKNRKLPHVGWNELNFKKKHPIFENVREHVDYYFVHSYYVQVDHQVNSLFKTKYGFKEFDSGIVDQNIYGVQFHPEKSHKFGMNLFNKFANI